MSSEYDYEKGYGFNGLPTREEIEGGGGDFWVMGKRMFAGVISDDMNHRALFAGPISQIEAGGWIVTAGAWMTQQNKSDEFAFFVIPNDRAREVQPLWLMASGIDEVAKYWASVVDLLGDKYDCDKGGLFPLEDIGQGDQLGAMMQMAEKLEKAEKNAHYWQQAAASWQKQALEYAGMLSNLMKEISG